MKTKTHSRIINGTWVMVFFIVCFAAAAQKAPFPIDNAFRWEPGGLNSLRANLEDSEWQPMTSVYIEFGGKLMYSLNVDFRKRENFAWSLGMSVMTDESGDPLTYYQTMFFPSVMGYYLTGPKRRIELGGGGCPLIGTEQGLAAVAIFGSAGYRYQKKKGLIFRVNFMPFIGIPVDEEANFTIMPWGGISIGYSF